MKGKTSVGNETQTELRIGSTVGDPDGTGVFLSPDVVGECETGRERCGMALLDVIRNDVTGIQVQSR